MSSWAELRAVQKKEQLLEKGMQRKRRWIREVRTETCSGWQAQLGNLQCVRTLSRPGLENGRLERLRSGVWGSAV